MFPYRFFVKNLLRGRLVFFAGSELVDPKQDAMGMPVTDDLERFCALHSLPIVNVGAWRREIREPGAGGSRLSTRLATFFDVEGMRWATGKEHGDDDLLYTPLHVEASADRKHGFTEKLLGYLERELPMVDAASRQVRGEAHPLVHFRGRNRTK